MPKRVKLQLKFWGFSFDASHCVLGVMTMTGIEDNDSLREVGY